MSTLWFTHPSGFSHLPPQDHPERVDRLHALNPAIAALGLTPIEAPIAEEAEVRRCHPQSYIEALRAAEPAEGAVAVDPDTWLSPGSLTAAFAAVGACNAAVEAVVSGKAKNAFVGCRPPGHHAERERAMGFCLFGTVAIAAKYALDQLGLSRVAVVDFDVHHGNGTQDLLWDDPRCLFISSHQVPLYPGTGLAQETGAHDNVLNIPLAPGTDGAAMRALYQRLALPRLREFNPELLLISAGFDAHRDDPLAQLEWEVDDYIWLTDQLCDVADQCCGGRVVSSLEGGYNLAALAAAAAAHVGRLKDRGG